MKDLFVLTADSDAQAFIRAILQRHQALQIRPITFEVRRLTGRDSGMVKEGPEIARAMVRKTEYSRLILMWDHHGSGWDKRPLATAADRIQQRLDGVTWTDRSGAIAVEPELEEWLWTSPGSIMEQLGSNVAEFDALVAALANKLGMPRERCCRHKPKELFEAVLYQKKRRRPLPEDFASLASSADIEDMSNSETFAHFVDLLKAWF